MCETNDKNIKIPNAANETVSVIIPCYNSERYLENCFRCLDNSTYENLQIIFIDDGSEDKTAEKIKNYVSEREKAEYHYISHSGVADARNKGLKYATGKYVTFYDVDDTITPHHFENLKNTVETYGADVAVCAYTRDKIRKIEKLKKSEPRIFYGENALERLLSQNIFNYCLWNKMYRAEIIREKG